MKKMSCKAKRTFIPMSLVVMIPIWLYATARCCVMGFGWWFYRGFQSCFHFLPISNQRYEEMQIDALVSLTFSLLTAILCILCCLWMSKIEKKNNETLPRDLSTEFEGSLKCDYAGNQETDK